MDPLTIWKVKGGVCAVDSVANETIVFIAVGGGSGSSCNFTDDGDLGDYALEIR